MTNFLRPNEFHRGKVYNLPAKTNKSKNIFSETGLSPRDGKYQKNSRLPNADLISSMENPPIEPAIQDDEQLAISAAGIQPLEASANEIIPWNHENIFGNVWDTSPYKAYLYKDVAFRLMFPNGYDSTANDGKKYPLILHIAGRGEAGTDNELQLRHAGPGHKKAIEEDKFPGFALFPQIQSSNGFATFSDLKNYTEIIELLIKNNKVDPNRIYVHGLSAGGDATWRLIRDYPHLFAAALPMSWSHNKYVSPDSLTKKYIHIPIWISQGGKDDFPPATQTNAIVKKIRDKGGNIRYNYLPNAGHGTWTTMYNHGGFFPFMLRQSKLNIHVYYGQTSFCPGEAIDVTLGISPGFDGYEWEKDGQPVMAGLNQNEIQVTEVGSYRVRFKRKNEWTEWSEPVVIDNNREVLPTVEISTNGKSRNLVTALDNSTSVNLTVPEGYEKYIWKKNNTVIPGSTTHALLVSEPGSYTVAISEPSESPVDENGVPKELRPPPPRCESAFSAPVVVTTQDNPGVPVPPANFTVSTKTPFSLQIRWDDVADNELGFEIYRASQSGGPYTLVTITLPDATAYTDEMLSDQTTYFYKARAVNNQGGSTYTSEKSATTGTDTSAPDAPADFAADPVSSSQIDLTWSDKAFNEKGYKIFRSISENGPFELIHTTAANIDSLADTGLSGHTTYFYQILAFNNQGESDTISSEGISTLNGNPVITAIEPQTVKTGDTVAVTLTANDPDDDTILLEIVDALDFTTFEDHGDGSGTLKIMPVSSDEGFYGSIQMVAKDDHEGSSSSFLLITVINNELTEVVYINFGSNHAEGAPWNNTASPPVLNQTYNTFLDASAGQTTPIQMKVLAGWDAEGVNGTTTQNNSGVFPDSVLAKGWQTSDSAALELSGLDPELLYNFTFLASKAGFDTGETAFYINGQKVTVDASRNVDHTVSLNGIVPDAQGKVTISVVKSGASAKGYLNALVVASYENGIPIQPTDLQATPVARTQIRLQWHDQAGNEEGYEIYRALGANGEFSLLTTTAANATTFTDEELVNNTAYRYQVRAFNSLGNSNYSNIVTASTLNQQILVNFNGSTHVMAPAPWNNTARTPTEGAVIPNLKDDLENETGIDLFIEKWGTGFDNKLGLTTGDNSGVYPDAVLETYYFLEPFDEPVRFVFTGLDPHLSYNFTFFGDGGSGAVSDNLFMPGSDLRTQFIIGKDTVILNALDNTSKTVQIKKVIPDEENTVTVSIMAYEGATVETSAIFGIFNSIVVDGFYAENILTNNSPVIASIEDQSFKEGDTVSLQIQAIDADGNPIAFGADNLPDGLNIDPVTGLISGVVSKGAMADSPYAVEVTANDSLPVNNLSKLTFNIQITETGVVCTTPTALSAELKIIGESAGALLNWTGDTTAIGYTLRYREMNGTTWDEVQIPNNSTYTLKNLSFDTEYEWHVQGECAENTVSDTSAIQTFKTPVAPADVCEVPQNVSTEVISSEGAPNTTTVTWEAVSGATGYEIEYSVDSTHWTMLTPTETSVSLTELTENTDYHVLVRTVCAEDGSMVSENAYVSFHSGNWEDPVCSTPENVSYTFISDENVPNTVVITWEAVSSGISYEIEYSTDSTHWTKLTSTETSVSLTELTENTDYHVLVYAVCAEDGSVVSENAYITFNTGSSSEVCVIADDLTVVEQIPNDSTVDVTLTWQGPESAAFYYVLYAEKETGSWEKMKVTSDTTQLADLLPETTYQWAVITGCSSDESLVSDTSAIAEFITEPADVVSGIDDDLEDITFKVYPVPSQGRFTVEFTTSHVAEIQMMVYDVLGDAIYQTKEKTPAFSKEVNLYAPKPGVYFIRLIVGDQVYSKRILIQ